jgi:hypothetical protein
MKQSLNFVILRLFHYFYPMSKKVVIRKVKPRNGGKFTESAFWTYIRAALRQKSRWWYPITIAKNKAKQVYNGPNKRQKFEYLCSHCLQCFPEKDVNVHHKIECGSLTCADDLPGFVERLFCEEPGLEVVCNKCHDKIHKK